MTAIAIYHLDKEFVVDDMRQADSDKKRGQIIHAHPHATKIISSLSGLSNKQLTDEINTNIKILEYCSRVLLDRCNEYLEDPTNLGMMEIVKKEARDDCDLRMVLLQKLANITINDQ